MKEGKKLKKISPMNSVSVYIMPDRVGASNMFCTSVDITKTEEYIHSKRALGLKGFGLMHVFLAAYTRTVASYPGVNRFIRGQRIYARNSIDICLTIKKDFSLDGDETVIKIPVDPRNTAEDIFKNVNSIIAENKNCSSHNGMDNTAGFFTHIPGFMLKFIIWFLKLIDYFGLLPSKLIKVSPFHGSMFITNVGSLGIPPVFHHLYSFGNLPMFISIGAKRHENKLKDNGEIEKRKYVDITIVCDERICDGHYYATAFKSMKKLVENPNVLDNIPEHVNNE